MHVLLTHNVDSYSVDETDQTYSINKRNNQHSLLTNFDVILNVSCFVVTLQVKAFEIFSFITVHRYMYIFFYIYIYIYIEKKTVRLKM